MGTQSISYRKQPISQSTNNTVATVRAKFSANIRPFCAHLTVLRIRIRDLVLFLPLDPGSGMNILYQFSESLETVFWVKNYLNSLIRIRIWNLFDPGSGMEKFGSGTNIPDPQHCILDISQNFNDFTSLLYRRLSVNKMRQRTKLYLMPFSV